MVRSDNGLLIVFEGIDGAGKTTQVEHLAAFLDRAGVPFVRSKEPTDGPLGKQARATGKGPRLSLEAELHAFTEDRRDHVQRVINPALAAGRVVILDRYLYSTIAYQSVRGANPAEIAATQLTFAPVPDVVFLLDVPPAVGIERISVGRGERPNSFETSENLTVTRAAFLALAKDHPVVRVVNASRDAESVRREVTECLIEGAFKRRFCAKAYGCDEPFACGYRNSGTCQWARLCAAARL